MSTALPSDSKDPVVVASVATTKEVLALPELHEGLLEPWERERLSKIRLPGRRDDVLASRLLLRQCIARATGLPLRGSVPAQFCTECGQRGHGRPYLPDHPGLGVSLSHAEGLVAAAVGPGAVGVDVELLTRRPAPWSALHRVLPESELRLAAAQADPEVAMLRLWVRREARVKAGEQGLRLLEWTDHYRKAVVAVASCVPVASGRSVSDHGWPATRP
ncbi:4'-phosphopantetheinyl transferase family protein [Streptomyces sp. NPDC006879]|uniref:4'-phosphopantetheinyl transferase family protein n=1 Tax=Streptomyces sp. NPDC006879 TaxID=3364767 RepID=UPI00369F07EA